VDRFLDKTSVCRTGRLAIVDSSFPHFGEERCLRGWKGSGTVFFAHCNLRCVFCQNFDLSQSIRPESVGLPASELSALMLHLQKRGCHNINLVTPEHIAPQIVEALAQAVKKGLRIPVVYNTSGYDSLESLRLLEGLVDIYMPDFKFWFPAPSKRYIKAEDYPTVARQAIAEMHRQVGDLILDQNGLAVQGLLIRHLVMPGHLADTRRILGWIASTLGTSSYVNLMDQYHPAGQVSFERHPELNRRLYRFEWDEAVRIARNLELRLDGK